MRTSDLVASAGRSLRANPLRSALTALGVIIGVSSVVAMVAMGAGAQRMIEKTISNLGSNLMIVSPAAANNRGGVRGQAGVAGGGRPLTLGDAEAIAQLDGVAAVAPIQRGRGQIVANGLNWNTQIEGATTTYVETRNWDVSAGRFFDDSELRQARRVVVLGATVVQQIFPDSDPIGQTVRINNGAYLVIGVMEDKGQTGMGPDQDDILIAPFTTVKRRISGRTGRADTVSMMWVKATDKAALARVQEDVGTLLRQRHRTRTDEDDFTLMNLTSIAAAAQETTQIFTYLLAGVSAVSLLVGGIGIMNIMLVSVTERTREIGLRKALGARQTDILHQFALEAVTLSLAGGVMGLLLGVMGAWGITSALGMPFVISSGNAAMAIAFSVLVGVLFGAYPAWRAAQLDPIEALRRE